MRTSSYPAINRFFPDSNLFSFQQLLGFCWQNEVNSNNIKERGLTMITELGQPIDVLALLQLPWQERLRVSNCKTLFNYPYYIIFML